MKILLISFYYTPDYCAGSFRAQSIHSSILKESKVEKCFVYTTTPHRYGYVHDKKTFNQYKRDGVIKFKVPYHKNKFLKQVLSFSLFAFKTFFTSLKNKNKIDLILITSSRFGTALLGYVISVLIKKPLAVDIRDIFSDSLSSINDKSFLIKIIVRVIKKLESLVLKHASWVNFVSPGFLSYFKKLDLDNPRVYTNGIDNIFLKKNNNTQKKNNLKNNKLLNIVYAGNIGFGQGLESIIIPLAKIFSDRIHFTIIGDGSAKQIFLDEIIKNSLSNISINEPVDRRSLIECYNQADCLFLHLNDIPAFKRVLPSKIFEYSTYLKPVLAGVGGTAKDFIKENVNGFFLFHPGDVQMAKIHIETIIQKKETIIIENKNFIKKYNRSLITERMIKDLVSNFEAQK